MKQRRAAKARGTEKEINWWEKRETKKRFDRGGREGKGVGIGNRQPRATGKASGRKNNDGWRKRNERKTRKIIEKNVDQAGRKIKPKVENKSARGWSKWTS